MKKPKLYKPKKLSSRKQFRSSQSKSTRRARFYDNDWNRYRRRFLHHNPHCYTCGATASVCDHIVAFKQDLELFMSVTNHMPLCVHCHNTVTGLFDRHDEPDLDGKLKWIAQKRKEFNIKIKVKVLPYYKR